MTTKEHLTPEIDAAFIGAGCLTMLTDTTDVDYYHSGAGIYLRYFPTLNEQKCASQTNLTEIVAVTSTELPETSIRSEILSEVISLHDLPAFLRYRASGVECESHRLARQTYEIAQDDFEEAHFKMTRSAKAFRIAQTKASIASELLEKAHDVQLAATAAFFAHKPPPFRDANRMTETGVSQH